MSVSGSTNHSCGVRADQTVACWGANYNGQADPPAGKFWSVSVGAGYSCGLLVDQALACWGENAHEGPAQDGSTSTIQDNRAVPPAGRFLSVSAGVLHACGVRTDKTVTCWGSNRHFDPETGDFVDDGRATAPAGQFGP